MLVRKKSINFFSAIEKYSSKQDTLIQVNNNSVVDSSKKKDSISSQESININLYKTMDIQSIDSILKRSEERERQIVVEKQKDTIIPKPVYRKKIDTAELMYKQFGISGFPIKKNLEKDHFNQNVLYNFSNYKPKERAVDQVFSYSESETAYKTESVTPSAKTTGFDTNKIQFDWITILLIGSFLLLGWVRLFNKKYMASMLKAIVNYNESVNLYREKNSLMERASFIINLLFVSNLSLFILQLVQFFDIVQLPQTNVYRVYLYLCVGGIGLYILRATSSVLIGKVFLKEKIFAAYFHNVNLYTKTVGVFLFPLIVVLQFIAYEYLGIIIYIGILIVGLLYVFQILRAFQIIIRNNASIFYMILYLCAFEIAPILIIYKLLLSHG